MTALITGVGAALPQTCVANTFFQSLGVSSDWIVSRTGVRERYHLLPEERLVDLAAEAARTALVDSGIEADAIDMVIVATSTPDRISPGLAAELAYLIGAGHVGAVDMNGACTGFLYALDYAISRIEHGASDCVLVVGADAMSRLTNRADPNTAFLFGDGAGAVIVQASAKSASADRAQYLSFGSAGAAANNLLVGRETGLLEMDGGEVYAAAVDAMAAEIESVLMTCQVSKDEIDHVVCHQANERIIKAVARQLQLPVHKAVSYVAEFGNTSSASIPIALWKAQQDGRLKYGNRVVLAAFGAGFTWGAGIVNWKGCQA
jgi:3-oxoacyl-[acyl-carrier-protein] synthase III